jgi:UDP-N-acetylmuramate dehydrogenase
MNIYRDFPLSKLLWYKIGGTARFVVEVSEEEDVKKALDFIEREHLKKFIVVGLGANILFNDEYYDGAVIHIVRQKPEVQILGDGRIKAFAGEIVQNVAEFSYDNNLTGLEWSGGLPGTIGAGTRGNAGAFGGDFAKNFVEAEVLVIGNGMFDTKIINKEDIQFGYRTSPIKTEKNMVVLSSTFALKPSTPPEVEKAREEYKEHIDYRATRHPIEYPNCGSVFKNLHDKEQVEKVLEVFPDLQEKVDKDWYGKVSVGYLIGRLGFSGYQVGQAQASEKQCNFIVNLGGAKFTDVITIIEAIKNKFYDTFGFYPESEIEIVYP